MVTWLFHRLGQRIHKTLYVFMKDKRKDIRRISKKVQCNWAMQEKQSENMSVYTESEEKQSEMRCDVNAGYSSSGDIGKFRGSGLNRRRSFALRVLGEPRVLEKFRSRRSGMVINFESPRQELFGFRRDIGWY